jgi:tetratricopeptide (TPR) repeat protein
MLDEAIAHYQQALKIKPNSIEACYNLGNALLQKGNTAEAIVHIEKALELARAAGRQNLVERLNAELKQLQSAIGK